jgi:hypothetical protein
VGLVFALGAGALISAVSFELAQEGFEIGRLVGFAVATALASLSQPAGSAGPSYFQRLAM